MLKTKNLPFVKTECTEYYYVTMIMVQIENRTKCNLLMRNASYL